MTAFTHKLELAIPLIAIVVLICGPATTVFGQESAASDDDSTGTQERKPVVVTDQAREIHAKTFVFDGHNDLPWVIRSRGSMTFERLDIWFQRVGVRASA